MCVTRFKPLRDCVSQRERGVISAPTWTLFSHGLVRAAVASADGKPRGKQRAGADAPPVKADAVPRPEGHWTTDAQWAAVAHLEHSVPALQGLCQSLDTDLAAWYEWVRSQAPLLDSRVPSSAPAVVRFSSYFARKALEEESRPAAPPARVPRSRAASQVASRVASRVASQRQAAAARADPDDLAAIDAEVQRGALEARIKEVLAETDGSFLRLVLLRVLREDALPQAFEDYVAHTLGPSFTNLEPPVLAEVFEDSSPTVPIALILSTGADPTAMFLRFAQVRMPPLAVRLSAGGLTQNTCRVPCMRMHEVG